MEQSPLAEAEQSSSPPAEAEQYSPQAIESQIAEPTLLVAPFSPPSLSPSGPQAHEIRIQISVTPSSPPTSPSGSQAHEFRIKILVPPSSPPTSPFGPQASEISETQSSPTTSLSNSQAFEQSDIRASEISERQSGPATSPSDSQASEISETQSNPATSPYDPQASEPSDLRASKISERQSGSATSPSDPQASGPSDPQAQSTQAEPPQLELYKENRALSVKLYTAALNGDWETIKRKLGKDPRQILRAKITEGEDTVLHVAAGARQTQFVEKLMNLNKMNSKDLELPNKIGNTAFCLAAVAGAKSIVDIMMKKNENLPDVRCNLEATPLLMAAMYGQGDMVTFLFPKTKAILEKVQTELPIPKHRSDLFFTCVDVDLFDLAFTLLNEDPRLAEFHNGDEGTALHMLARKPSAFPIESPRIWKTLINSCMMSKHKRKSNENDPALKLVTRLWKIVLKGDDEKVLDLISKPSDLLFEAAELGNFKFLAELVRLYPNLMWQVDNRKRTIFHIAVLHRHASIFNQIHNIGSIKDFIAEQEDDSKNNVLHLAANQPCQSRLNEVSGAALQMQQELIWFQEVEKIVLPSHREKKNEDNLTPRELFTYEHKELLKAGEKWMKGRAEFCLVVSTIITTVVFAAALALPKRINDSVKTPNLLADNWFQVFTMSVAISFSFSLFSIMIFLSLLTSRYTEKDFLRSLPYKLMAGLLTLFISMIAMMLAFTAAFFVAYDSEKRWAPILISATAFLPAAIFVWLQCSLFFDVFKSTLFSKSLFQPSKPMICKKPHRKNKTKDEECKKSHSSAGQCENV